MNIYLHITIQSHWLCSGLIYHLQLYGASLGFGNHLNYYVVMLTLDPLANKTFFTIYFLICA
jgi:F0F1-type ATP synthase membrane subunit c/vacuolar-type H+-ATPase subunit K